MTAIEIQALETSWMKETVPEINVGDTVSIGWTIVEGKKKRVQKFEGTVIKTTGIRSRAAVTVRKIIEKIGVEKTFLIHSPLIADVKVLSRGKVRRARLHYLRQRVGKATRVKTMDYRPQAAVQTQTNQQPVEEAGPEPGNA